MPPQLYSREGCTRCATVRLALALDGREITAHVADDAGSPECAPALVLEDGTRLVGPGVILRHLAATTGSRLLPDGRRDQALTWMLVERAETILGPLCLRAATGRDGSGAAIGEQDLRLAERRLEEELAMLEGLLERGPYLFGDRPTVADLVTHAFFERLGSVTWRRLSADWQRVGAWHERVAAASTQRR